MFMAFAFVLLVLSVPLARGRLSRLGLRCEVRRSAWSCSPSACRSS